MVSEVIDAMVIDDDGWYVDGTLGAGGHSAAILAATGPKGRLFAVDRDPSAFREAEAKLGPHTDQITFALGNFRELPELLPLELHGRISGILLDLGLRSTALDEPDRGFSFQADGPLDMRFNPERGESAADLLRRLREVELVALLAEGTSRANPKKMARDIVRWRRENSLRTTGDLVQCLRASLGRWATPKLLSSVFSAIRMAVNDELFDLDKSLVELPALLRTEGVLCVLAYQSLEDRRVKSLRRAILPDPATGDYFQMEPLTKKPQVPDRAEARTNRRARSAKMRAFRRIPATRPT
jgi:16S rRNA (cytosine1402-N4)-methyltransferase